MGLSEREYYTNLPYTNYCKIKGYEDRQEETAAIHRRASWLIHCSLVQKPVTIREYWPLPSDKKIQRDTILPPDKAMIERIKKAHNLK